MVTVIACIMIACIFWLCWYESKKTLKSFRGYLYTTYPGLSFPFILGVGIACDHPTNNSGQLLLLLSSTMPSGAIALVVFCVIFGCIFMCGGKVKEKHQIQIFLLFWGVALLALTFVADLNFVRV